MAESTRVFVVAKEPFLSLKGQVNTLPFARISCCKKHFFFVKMSRLNLVAVDSSEHSDRAFNCKYHILIFFSLKSTFMAYGVVFPSELHNGPPPNCRKGQCCFFRLTFGPLQGISFQHKLVHCYNPFTIKDEIILKFNCLLLKFKPACPMPGYRNSQPILSFTIIPHWKFKTFSDNSHILFHSMNLFSS